MFFLGWQEWQDSNYPDKTIGATVASARFDPSTGSRSQTSVAPAMMRKPTCEGEKRACLHRTSCTISASPKLSSRPARVIFSVFFTCGGDSTNPTPGAGDPHLSGKLSDDESLRCPRMQIDLAFPEMLEG
jgi:hypothetical protein